MKKLTARVGKADDIFVAHGANRGKDRRNISEPSTTAAYVTVFNGSVIQRRPFPHLARWATNMAPSSTVYLKTVFKDSASFTRRATWATSHASLRRGKGDDYGR